MISFSKLGNMYTSDKEDIKLSIIAINRIMKYFFNISFGLFFLFIIIMKIFFVNIMLYIPNTHITIIFIICWGKTYNMAAGMAL